MLGSYTFVMILCLQRRTQQWLNHVPQIFPSITAVVTGECTYQTVGCNVWSTQSCGAHLPRCYCQVPTASGGKFRGVSGLAELKYYYPLQKYKVVVETGYYHKQVDLEPNLQREAFDTEAN